MGGGKVEQAVWVGYGLLVAVSWGLGLRALHAAIQRRGVLDWGLAAVAIAAGGVGCPLSLLPSLTTLSPGLRSHVIAAGIAGIGVGSIALYLVNWRYFRPKSVTAALVCTAGSFIISWSFLAEVLTAGFAWGRDRRWLAIGGIACWVPYAWGAAEMLREAARRRRGLPAPRGGETAQTLLLYGLAQAGVALVFPPALASAYRSGGGVHSPFLVSVVAVVAVAAALAAAVAFSSGARRRTEGAPRGAGDAP